MTSRLPPLEVRSAAAKVFFGLDDFGNFFLLAVLRAGMAGGATSVWLYIILYSILFYSIILYYTALH